MLACQTSAQTTQKYDGVSFSKMSPNGKWLIENLQGTMNILDRNTGTQYSCQDDNGVVTYMPGQGSSVTNDGKVVGMNGDYAAVWYKGTWTNLPQATGVGSAYNTAHAITPDESRIVGVLGRDGASLTGDNDMMAYPVVWTKGADGTYTCEKLPCPKKDFAGLAPQYITAMCISDDGKTVAGQVRDFTGFYVMPIVYTEGADGTWTYKVLGQKEVYDESKIGELPEMPTAPTMPDVTKYMSSTDIDNYNNAVEYYNEQLQLYYDGVISEYPEYPMQEDYISDATSKAKYQADLAQYQKDQQKFNEDYTAYVTKRDEIVTNKSFVQNSVILSADGRSLGLTLEDRSTSDGWGGASDKYAGYFDLTQSDPQFTAVTTGGDYLTTAMLNDRTMLVATPSMEYTRNTFVVKNDAKHTTVSLPEYIAERNPDAAKWVKDNNTFDVNIYGYDDDWNQIVTGTVKDSLVTGTVAANADGTVFVSFYTDTFTSQEEQSKVSYVVDLNSTVGINTTAFADDRKRGGVKAEGNTVTATAEGAKMEIYDADGRLVGTAKGKATLAKGGVYVVRTTDADGHTAIAKVATK